MSRLIRVTYRATFQQPEIRENGQVYLKDFPKEPSAAVQSPASPQEPS